MRLERGTPGKSLTWQPPQPLSNPDPELLNRIMEKHRIINPNLVKIFPDGSYSLDDLSPEEFERRDEVLNSKSGSRRIGYDD